MNEDSRFYPELGAVVLAFGIPAWIPVILRADLRSRIWKPACFVTLSLLEAAWFLNGRFPLYYSLRFAAVGTPLSIFAIVLVRRTAVSARIWVVITSALSLLVWWLIITAH
jgi:hypothetical protein